MPLRLFLACFLATLVCLTAPAGCVWPHFEQRGGLDQDPKLGPGYRLSFRQDKSKTQAYVGGEVYRQTRLTIGTGVIHSLSDSSSLEIGYRSMLWRNEDAPMIIDIDPWEETQGMFFIGGRINW